MNSLMSKLRISISDPIFSNPLLYQQFSKRLYDWSQLTINIQGSEVCHIIGNPYMIPIFFFVLVIPMTNILHVFKAIWIDK